MRRATFKNLSDEILKRARVYEAIPAHAQFVAGSATNGGDYAVAFSTTGGQDNYPVAAPGSTAVTNIRWIFKADGNVSPGTEGQVTYRLQIK